MVICWILKGNEGRTLDLYSKSPDVKKRHSRTTTKYGERRRNSMPVFALDVYQTTGLAMLLFALGTVLVNKIGFLRAVCLPAPVVGGLLFAIVNCVLYMGGIVEITFDTTLQSIFMVWFFTSVGYNASFKLLAKGAVAVVIFLALATGMQVIQNIVGVVGAGIFGLDARLGLCMGSIPLVGGHGTAASWGPMLEEMGVEGANVVGVAAATFGLVSGSLMGGPLARSLISKYNLKSTAKAEVVDAEATKVNPDVYGKQIMTAFCLLIAAAGIGLYVTNFLKQFITLPAYIGPMIIAVIVRNAADAMNIELPTHAIDSAATVCLSIFLSLALMTLKLWQLIDLALPMICILAIEVVVMFILARFVVYNVMGHDYDAAVLVAGFCGFGMGATPNAMANMSVICEKFGPSPKAYLVVPIVGGMFVDFTNTFVLTMFLNFI